MASIFRDQLDEWLVRIEQDREVIEPWSISAHRYTAGENVALWNTYDWSKHGEEWTRSAEWKSHMVEDYLVPHVPQGCTALEIGPGGGRWTDYLRHRTSRLVVLDLAERALELCRKRFADASNIEYLLGSGCDIDLPEQSVDAIWSYDVFVHINPVDTRAYFREFGRILKPGGCAVIHHPGPPTSNAIRKQAWRSDVTDQMVRHFVTESGLELVKQTQQHIKATDMITIARKPS